MQGIENIYSYEIDRFVNDKSVFIIDLRSKKEYENSHILGAVNILPADIEKRLRSIPRNKTILVYCSSGGRSIIVARNLAKYGYNVKNVIDGIKKYHGSSLT